MPGRSRSPGRTRSPSSALGDEHVDRAIANTTELTAGSTNLPCTSGPPALMASPRRKPARSSSTPRWTRACPRRTPPSRLPSGYTTSRERPVLCAPGRVAWQPPYSVFLARSRARPSHRPSADARGCPLVDRCSDGSAERTHGCGIRARCCAARPRVLCLLDRSAACTARLTMASGRMWPVRVRGRETHGAAATTGRGRRLVTCRS